MVKKKGRQNEMEWPTYERNGVFEGVQTSFTLPFIESPFVFIYKGYVYIYIFFYMSEAIMSDI